MARVARVGLELVLELIEVSVVGRRRDVGWRRLRGVDVRGHARRVVLAHIEDTYSITVPPEAIRPETFGSIRQMAAVVEDQCAHEIMVRVPAGEDPPASAIDGGVHRFSALEPGTHTFTTVAGENCGDTPLEAPSWCLSSKRFVEVMAGRAPMLTPSMTSKLILRN